MACWDQPLPIIIRFEQSFSISGQVIKIGDEFASVCHIKVQLETGRTHQIRVHMSHLRHPLVGEPVYAGRQRVPAGAQADLLAYLQSFKRQALHAWKLSLTHPLSGEECSWESPLPTDFEILLQSLRDDRQVIDIDDGDGKSALTRRAQPGALGHR